jgi:hypothetical protein
MKNTLLANLIYSVNIQMYNTQYKICNRCIILYDSFNISEWLDQYTS